MSFFETYKRPIFLAVAIFALITFSITGVMLSFIGDLAQPSSSDESIEIADGERVQLSVEDINAGLKLARLQRNLRYGVDMPAFIFANVPLDNPRETFAILRRVAVEEGIDVADEDIEQVIEFACRQKESMQPNQPPPPRLNKTLLAKVFNAGSIVELEEMIREALRVSMLVRAEMQALDVSEAALADYVKEQRKRRTVSYVRWDGKGFRAELERLPPDNQALAAWIAGLPENERAPFVNAEVVGFETAGLIFEQADPDEWAELLEGIEIGDADVEARYNADKEALYKIDEPKKPTTGDGGKDGGEKPEDKTPEKTGDGKDGGLLAQDPAPKTEGPQPPEDEAKKDASQDDKKDQGPIGPVPPEQVGYRRIDEVKGEILRKLKVEAIVRKLAEKAEQARAAAVEAARKAKEAEKDAEKDREKGPEKNSDAPKPDADKSAEKKAGDGKDGALLSQVQIPGPGASGDMTPEQQQEAAKQEQMRLQQQRADMALFDLKKWYEENMATKKGAVWVPAKGELAPPDSFQDFPPFGKWSSYWTLSQLQELGSISNLQPAEKGAFFVRLTDRKRNVPKPIEEVRETALESYYDRESSAKAKTLAEEFRKLVRQKAEELVKDEVAKLRDAVPGKVDERVKTWRTDLEAQVKDLQDKLAASDLPSSAIPVLQKQLEDVRGKLALESTERERVQKIEDEKLEAAIVEKIEPVMAEAFTLAAKEKSIDIEKLGPFFDDESNGARFSLLDDGPEKFLKSNTTIRDAEKGHVSEPVEDAAVQTWYVVRVDAVEDGDSSALTRKAMEAARDQFIADRVRNVLTHSFSHRALKERYQWKTKAPEPEKTDTGE